MITCVIFVFFHRGGAENRIPWSSPVLILPVGKDGLWDSACPGGTVGRMKNDIALSQGMFLTIHRLNGKAVADMHLSGFV